MTIPSAPPRPVGPDGYRLLELLGRGAFGEVWRAEAPGGIQVAVKVLSIALKPDEAQRELQALQAIRELRHPYLVALQAIFAYDDRILIVMELADGSLGSRLAFCEEQGQTGIPVRELLGYLREAAEAIDFLHAHNRLHRDIKPDNILLVAGHVKVADYGLARVLEKQQTARTNSVVGTPSYMAPETWEGSVGPRSDQYSLAAAYVELRRGFPPFEAQNLPALAYLHMNHPPNLDGIAGAERRVLEKALAKKSADRYPTCMVFATGLARAVQSAAAPVTPTKAIPYARPAKKVPVSKPATTASGRETETTLGSRTTSERPTGRNSRLAWAGCLALLLVATVVWIGGWLYYTGPGDRKDSARAVADAGAPRGNRLGGEVIEVEISEKLKMTFCWIPPGKATLGPPATEKNHSDDETEHEYTSRGFWLAKYPATQEQWQALMKDNPSYFSADGGGKQRVVGIDTSHFPVENVCWDDSKDKEHSVQEFLRKMNVSVKAPAAMGQGKFALPNEDEWEYACRGGKGNKQPFYFGDRLNGDKANCDGNYPYGTETKGDYKERTTEVGSYEKLAPHPWGLCDMHGNVWQWCDNIYKDDKDSRVLRGGSWFYSAVYCRAANRDGDAPGFRNYRIGVRPCFRQD